MKKRVLHVTSSLEGGGIQTFLMHLLRSFRDRFAMDVLVMTDKVGIHEAEVKELGIQIHHMPLRGNILRFTKEYLSLVKSYDVVHLHRSSMIQGFPLKLAAARNVPVRIAHFQNISRAKSQTSMRRYATAPLRSLVMDSATTVIGVSHMVLKSHFGVGYQESPKFQVIPNCIDTNVYTSLLSKEEARERLRLSHDDFVILHSGRFSKAKNHRSMIPVMKHLTSAIPSAKLLLAGDGPLRPAIEKQVRSKKLKESVHFLGWQDDMRHLLAAADVFFFPSLWEGMPLALLEAMAAGLPIVASDIDCHREALPPELWKYRIPVANPLRAVAILKELAQDQELCKQLSTAARERAKQFDVRLIAERMARLYNQEQGG